MCKMRKLLVIYGKDTDTLTELVNNCFQKAQEIGNNIVSTSYVKEPFGGHYAYIEYETEPSKK